MGGDLEGGRRESSVSTTGLAAESDGDGRESEADGDENEPQSEPARIMRAHYGWAQCG